MILEQMKEKAFSLTKDNPEWRDVVVREFDLFQENVSCAVAHVD
jgi:hypothetical protein